LVFPRIRFGILFCHAFARSSNDIHTIRNFGTFQDRDDHDYLHLQQRNAPHFVLWIFLLNEIEWAAKVFQEASAKGFNEYSKGVLINYRAVIPPKWAIIACVVMI
jgi:hypothetical protein